MPRLRSLFSGAYILMRNHGIASVPSEFFGTTAALGRTPRLVVRAGSTCRCHQAAANPVLWIGAAASWAVMRSRSRSRSVRVNVQSNGVAVAL